jgi:plastocyanin
MFAGACLLGGGVWGACGRAPVREVVLLAKEMAFVLADDPETMNPALTFEPGERVRLMVKNEAPGLRHDLVIPAWGVAVEPIGFGERTAVTFTVPPDGARVEYYCRPHASMMRGLVNVGLPAGRAAAEP